MVNRIFPIDLTENLHLLKAEINGNFNKAAKSYPFSKKEERKKRYHINLRGLMREGGWG